MENMIGPIAFKYIKSHQQKKLSWIKLETLLDKTQFFHSCKTQLKVNSSLSKLRVKNLSNIVKFIILSPQLTSTKADFSRVCFFFNSCSANCPVKKIKKSFKYLCSTHLMFSSPFLNFILILWVTGASFTLCT